MADTQYSADMIVAGGGLAGITTTYELLTQGKNILLFEKDAEATSGGLAKESFAGIMMVGKPHQNRSRIPDTPELVLSDWLSYAELADDDHWPRKWSKFYCHNSITVIYEPLASK